MLPDAPRPESGLFGPIDLPRQAPNRRPAGVRRASSGAAKPRAGSKSAGPRLAPPQPVPATPEKNAIAAVALPVPVGETFDYLVPEALRTRVAPGHRVRVPFGHRPLVGIVVGLTDRSPATALRPIEHLLDAEPVFTPELLELARWTAAYYAATWGEVLDASLPAGVKQRAGQRKIVAVRIGVPPEECVAQIAELEAKPSTKKQAKVLKVLSTFERDFTPGQLASRLGITLSPIRTLWRKGLVRYEPVVVAYEPPFAITEPVEPPEQLTAEQETAVEAITGAIAAGTFAPFLLHGVTGAGKTEVYLRALEAALARELGAIVLVPEIALTPQLVRTFEQRLPAGIVAVWHSALTDRERHAQWRAIREGRARIVVGPRSAVLAPVASLGLIVVDEEHENSFKQQNVPRYHARDLAVQRAVHRGAVVVLGSATPSLETRLNAHSGKYTRLTLTHRISHRPLPPVEIVDLGLECAEQRRRVILSRRLEEELALRLARGEQAICFLNRRGFQTAIHCTRCGYAMRCEQCDVALTYHRQWNKAVCHYCFETREPGETCPACNTPNLTYQGVGTEQVEAELRARFPEAAIARMDSDTMTKREHYEQTLGALRDGALDILVGTQMIAKGLDVPNVTLVGVIHAESTLHLADFRARERTFQLIAQVAGRAGRGDKPGLVLVQTFHPDEPAIQLAARHDYERFYRRELADRRQHGYPPFSRLVLVLGEGRAEDRVHEALAAWAEALRARLPDGAGVVLQRRDRKGADPGNRGSLHAERAAVSARGSTPATVPGAIAGLAGVSVLGPAPAAIARLRGRFRWQFLVKAPGSRAVRQVVGVLKALKTPRGVRIAIDVDPAGLV